MSAILGRLGLALLSADSGVSANQFYRDLQAAGIGGRRSEVLQLYKIARGIIAKSPDEPFRDIRTAPTSSDLVPYPTRKATGIRQTVTLVYRDRITGKQLVTYHSTTSAEGVTRETAMATAINAYSDHAERYEQDLVGAVHTGAQFYQPFQPE
jgi:hypothetical protein